MNLASDETGADVKKPGEALRLTGGAPPGASPLSLCCQDKAESRKILVTLCHLLPLNDSDIGVPLPAGVSSID
jgi:hypothetical protein